MYEIALWLDAGNLLRRGFRNRLKCHLLQSNRPGFSLLKSIKVSLIAVNNIIVKKVLLKVSLITVNVIDYHFHLLL